MKRLLLLCLLCQLGTASAVTWSSTYGVGTTIPDNDSVGVSDTRTVSGSGISGIEIVTVTLEFSGGWNGDLYAYVQHDSGFSVLLNRPGRTLAAPDGSSTSGLNIVFDDTAPTEIHTAIPMIGGLVIGTFQPDGRITDPLVVLNTDPRPATLASFNTLSADGGWTLFVADQSPGNTSTLQSWTLTITGIPEPGTVALSGLGAIALFVRRRRQAKPACR
jgi:subtilisin-like proprotein convertase family protein